MCRTRKCVCLSVVFCFLIAWLSFQVWAKEKPDEETQGSLQNSPVIFLDSTSYDAGEVWEGDVVSHDFSVKNTGTSELIISKVKPG